MVRLCHREALLLYRNITDGQDRAMVLSNDVYIKDRK